MKKNSSDVDTSPSVALRRLRLSKQLLRTLTTKELPVAVGGVTTGHTHPSDPVLDDKPC